MRRRAFLRTASAAAVLAPLAWACGDDDGGGAAPVDESGIAHILPTASHDRLYLKVSLHAPAPVAPELRVDGRRVAGIATGSDGRFWAFDAQGLRSGRPHTLELRAGRRALSEAWRLTTLPAPDARPRRLRILAHTCAGGHEAFGFYVPIALRQRLLRRGLDFAPDVMVANGDHVYWDLRASISAVLLGQSPTARRLAGVFDRGRPVLGTDNEGVLTRAVGPQIAGLYGTMLRGVPTFFLRDDHDYFEDDQVTPALTTFPPDAFSRQLARASQWLFYPEFLPDPARPRDLPGGDAGDRPAGVSESFGTLRWGRLAEALLYDCKGFMQVAGAGLVPAAVEDWLHARMADADAAHLLHLPSNPPGYTAGKYAEWYPDVLGEDGVLTTDVAKPGWPAAWLAQHDRLLASAAAMARPAVFLSGDIHGQAAGRIVASGALDLRDNPVVSIITGTIGTGAGWPSAARGTRAMPPAHVALEDIVPVQEVNGFHLVDVEPEVIRIHHFRWRRGVDPPEAIDTLQPYHVSEHAR